MSDAVARYLTLTREDLPCAARDGRRWPVVNDHCFQRIILDHISGGVWYDTIPKPASRNLSPDQAARAVTLAEDILSGRADLVALNRQSLLWRGKLRG